MQYQTKTHPLQEIQVAHIETWEEWKRLWGATRHAEMLHGLLHVGFDISGNQGDAAERVCTYLGLADGHALVADSAFWRPNETQERGMERRTILGADLRRALAQKAFQMLCQKFFRNTYVEDRGRIPSWARLATHPEVLRKLVWFFRLDDRWGIPNLQAPAIPVHHLGLARTFVRDLAVFAWECETRGWYQGEISDEMIEVFRTARPDMLSLLFGLRQLEILLSLDRRYELNQGCMERLGELAMSYELYLPSVGSSGQEFRKPDTLEEACLGDSKAAQVLLVLRARHVAAARLKEMLALEMARREAEEKLRKFQGGVFLEG